MKILLVDANYKIVDEWRKLVEKYKLSDTVDVNCGLFQSFPADAIVSPANSYVIMDGGVDLHLRDLFDREEGSVEAEIRYKAIQRFGSAFVPVGCAIGIGLNYPENTGFKYLISAPTMSVPMEVSDTLNGYIATRAALRCAANMGCESVLLMGMGGLTGGYTPKQCAQQMIFAIMRHNNHEHDFMADWQGYHHLVGSIGSL